MLFLVATTLFAQAQVNGSRSPILRNSPNPKPLPNPPYAAAILLDEGFDDITTLTGAGWVMSNMSVGLGVTSWFQGNFSVFNAYDGAPSAYIGANFNNTSGVGTISNWLISPQLTISNGDQISFYTTTVFSSSFPDRLQLRLSTNGASTDVGADANSVGDFTTLILDINPALTLGGFPETWTQFTATITGLSNQVSGRFALRYYVTNGGPSGANSNYIGIDRVVFNSVGEVPVAPWALAIGIGLIAMTVVLRLRKS